MNIHYTTLYGVTPPPKKPQIIIITVVTISQIYVLLSLFFFFDNNNINDSTLPNLGLIFAARVPHVTGYDKTRE
jgi:heme/copper-type cytochrome/quinol oxidase subunit 4